MTEEDFLAAFSALYRWLGDQGIGDREAVRLLLGVAVKIGFTGFDTMDREKVEQYILSEVKAGFEFYRRHTPAEK